MRDVSIKIILKNKNNLLANANISVNTEAFGYVTLKGFQIWKSIHNNDRLNDYINITPAKIPARGNFFNIIFFESSDKWYLLEKIIYEKFRATKEEEIDIEEIPSFN